MSLLNIDLDSMLTYDSHTHFFGVGLPSVDFVIDSSSTDLVLPESLHDQNLIRGFGWSKRLPLKAFDTLCAKYPKKEFCLSYADGHSSFISQNLLDRLNFKSKNGKEIPSGIILSEVERDQFYTLMPPRSTSELKKMALHAQSVFLKNKITKVRHLTGNIDHWHCLKDLESQGLLEIQIEVFFSEFMGQSLNTALEALKTAQKTTSKKLSVEGLKIFYDGSFGSNTAYTSADKNSKARLSKSELTKKMKPILIHQKIPLAVHTIGDLALEDVIEVYAHLSEESDATPTLHLEHAPIFTKKTMEILENNSLDCVFHFQPSHWVDDQHWYLENKKSLGPHELYPFDFLDKNNYTYHFGSDAPVVAPTKENTLSGLEAIKSSKL